MTRGPFVELGICTDNNVGLQEQVSAHLSCQKNSLC